MLPREQADFIHKTWGYGVIVIPDLSLHEGFYVDEPDPVRAEQDWHDLAIRLEHANMKMDLGVVFSACVEMMTARDLRRSRHKMKYLTQIVSHRLQAKYWYVVARHIGGGGLHTRYQVIDAPSARVARGMMLELAIKAIEKLVPLDGAHRRRST